MWVGFERFLQQIATQRTVSLFFEGQQGGSKASWRMVLLDSVAAGALVSLDFAGTIGIAWYNGCPDGQPGCIPADVVLLVGQVGSLPTQSGILHTPGWPSDKSASCWVLPHLSHARRQLIRINKFFSSLNTVLKMLVGDLCIIGLFT